MTARMQSPTYPSTPLNQAIDFVSKVYKSERTNIVDRNVAVQAMGYNGISGRSAKVLSDLTQYGLLEKAGKSAVRVSKRSVEILHPESDASRRTALRGAAFEPELFQRISQRFPDGLPSEAALRSYFMREEFTDAAIPSAIRAYLQTCQFLEEFVGAESEIYSHENEQVIKENQNLNEDQGSRSFVTNQRTERQEFVSKPSSLIKIKPDFRYTDRKILLGGAITNKKDAEEAIAFINAIKQFLPDENEGDDEITGSE